MSSQVFGTIGFVGLGNIGKPMALRLAGSDFPLSVFDVAPDPPAELESAGAKTASSVAELASRVDVLCVMVRDDDQVRDVMGEVLGVADDGLTVVIHSTVAPGTPAELEDAATRHGVRVLDAPVSGGSMGAADGTLAILAGGSAEAFEHARPALEVMGSLVVHAGPIGAGTRMKLARNLIQFVSFAAVTEAQHIADAAGLDIKTLGEVVRHTDAVTGGAGAIMHRDRVGPVPPDDFWYAVLDHVRALGEKDLAFAAQLADSLAVDAPLTKLARERLGPGLGVVAEKKGR